MSAGAEVLQLQLGALVLDLNDTDDTGFLIAEVDLGYATPRAVTTDLPGQDGQWDDTSYFSTRTVQLTGAVVPTAAGRSRTKAKDKLAPFLAPNARPTLLYALDTDVDIRTLGLRVSQWSNPIDHPGNATQFSVQWVCPDPLSYGKSTNQVDVPLAAGSTLGFSFPFSFPLSFGGTGGPSGVTAILNEGTYGAWPVLRFVGPCTDPSLVWVDPTTGQPMGTQVVIAGGLVIPDGEYLEVDTKAKTALLNGDPSASRYNFVDFASTSWGPLLPGPNELRFSAASSSEEAVCSVLWRDTFLD